MKDFFFSLSSVVGNGGVDESFLTVLDDLIFVIQLPEDRRLFCPLFGPSMMSEAVKGPSSPDSLLTIAPRCDASFDARKP